MNISNEVQDALKTIDESVSGLTTKSGGRLSENDCYEIYIFALLLQAAKDAGFEVSLENINNGRMTFRGGPGHIWKDLHRVSYGTVYSASSSSFACFTVHTAVKVTGKSRVEHEADVLILSEKCLDCRKFFKISPWRVPIAIECKLYSNPVPLQVGRAALGFATELEDEGLFRYFLVANVRESSSITDMFESYSVLRYFPMTIPAHDADLRQAVKKVWKLLARRYERCRAFCPRCFL